MASPGHFAYSGSASYRKNFDRDVHADTGIFNRLKTSNLIVNGSISVTGIACFSDGTAADPGIRFCSQATGFFLKAAQTDRLFTSIEGVEVMNVQNLVDGAHIVAEDTKDLTVRSAGAAASTNAKFRTGDASAGASGQVTIHTGNATGGLSGVVNIFTGDSTTTTSGNIDMYTGTGVGLAVAPFRDDTGSIDIHSGAATDYESGGVTVRSGAISGAALFSGVVEVATGASTGSGESGLLWLHTGNTTDPGVASGQISVQTGNGPSTGPVVVTSGVGTTVGSGTARLASGAATGAGGTTGAVTVTSGQSTFSSSGSTTIGTGAASTTGGVGDIIIACGNSAVVTAGPGGNPDIHLGLVASNTVPHLVTNQSLAVPPSPSVGSIVATSTDISGQIIHNAGGAGDIVVTFGRAWTKKPHVLITPGSSATFTAGVFVDDAGTNLTQFTVHHNAGGDLLINYHCIA